MSREIWNLLDRVATLLAAVVVSTQSYSITDRLSNALSPEAVSKGIYEALRIFESMERRGIVEKNKEEEGVSVYIKDETGKEREIMVKGWMPTSRDISRLLEESEKDPVLARDLAAIAISKVVSSIG